MNTAPLTSTMLRTIKKTLQEICRSSVQVMPLEKLTEHPCDWLAHDMKDALAVLERTKTRLDQEIAQKTATIRQLEEQSSALARALGQPAETSAVLWVDQNLTVKESRLTDQLALLESSYSAQKQQFYELVGQIQEINEELEIEPAELPEALQPTGLVHQHHLATAQTALEQAHLKLAAAQQQTAERTAAIDKLAQRLGLPALPHAELEAAVTHAVQYLTTGDTAKLALALANETAANSGQAAVTSKLVLTRRLFEAMTRLAAQAEQHLTQLNRRISALQSRINTETAVVADCPLLQQSAVLSSQIAAMEEIYQTQIKEIFQRSLLKVEEYTRRLAELTDQPPSLPEYPAVGPLEFSQQEALLTEVESAAEALEQEYSILAHIKEFIQERQELLAKMAVFEEQASDPSRLFRSSFQLVSEEKFRKMAVPTLLRVEKEIVSLSDQYFSLFGKPPLIKQVAVVQQLKDEVASRIINTNVFMTGKCAKSKPAS